MNLPYPPLPHGIPVSKCPDCGKWSYLTRTDGRRAARILHPGKRMRTYRHLGRWHLTSQSAWTVAAWKDRVHRLRSSEEVAA